jgi:hypothetical protein
MSTALIFIALGILIKYFKMYSLIAGYNTMSKKEKENIDIKKLADVLRNGMFGMAMILIVGYLISEYTQEPKVENYFIFASFILGIPYMLIKSNSKNIKIKSD